jgi:hypothetical protein
MFHAFEILQLGGKVRREDLPDFNTPEDVMHFLSNNNSVSQRDGKFVRLDWMECVDITCRTCNKSH